MKRWFILSSLLLLVLWQFVSACREPASHTKHEYPMEALIEQLQQGDLALRGGRDVASYMLSQANVIDKRYSHCGLVQIENGHPFVYHFIKGPGREGLVRDPAKEFFSSGQNSLAGVMRYAMSEEERGAQSALILQYYQKQPGFDMSFDTHSPDKLYCSEFVCRVMNAIKKDSAFIRSVTKKGFTYIPVDRLYADGKAVSIWQMSFK